VKNGSVAQPEFYECHFLLSFAIQGGRKHPPQIPLNALREYPPNMRQLQTRHILLFRILRDHCPFLTRRQIERVLTLSRVSTTKTMLWMIAEQYLNRRYRADTFAHFQTPVYYLGKRGWHTVGKSLDAYKDYRMQIEQRSERTFQHTLSVHDVILKFVLEAEVKRIVSSEDKLWQEAIDFGNIPDAWIQFDGGEAFVEVDLGTERPIVLREKLDGAFFRMPLSMPHASGYANTWKRDT